MEAEDGEEELLNENVDSIKPRQFDRSVSRVHPLLCGANLGVLSDIVAVGPLEQGSQSLLMPCKVRVFKHKLNERIRIRTDREGNIRRDPRKPPCQLHQYPCGI